MKHCRVNVYLLTQCRYFVYSSQKSGEIFLTIKNFKYEDHQQISMTVDFRFSTLSQLSTPLSPVSGQYQVKFSVAAKLQMRLHLVNISYDDKMLHSKPFRTIEEALEYFYTLSDDEEPIDICQLPSEETDFCDKIEISTNIHNDEISHEDMFDPEEPSTTKEMPNLKRKLKSNERNVELRWRKKMDITKLMEKIYTGPHKTIYQSQLFLLQCLAEDSEKQLIHIIDYNKLTSGDKMGKISPFYAELENKKFSSSASFILN
ncbi:UNVERIFIED_CONTAM: hypothetical protein NCL1_36074 [Trichonephila clavipes]